MSINKKSYKTLEPLDDEISISRPMKIKSILQLLFEKWIYSVSNLLEDLKVNQEFLTILTGVEMGFFDKYHQNEQKIFTPNELVFKQ